MVEGQELNQGQFQKADARVQAVETSLESRASRTDYHDIGSPLQAASSAAAGSTEQPNPSGSAFGAGMPKVPETWNAAPANSNPFVAGGRIVNPVLPGMSGHASSLPPNVHGFPDSSADPRAPKSIPGILWDTPRLGKILGLPRVYPWTLARIHG